MNPLIPPQNLQAEKAVLGAVIIDNDRLLDVQQFLRPEDFYLPSHQDSFRAMCNLAEEKKPIDLVTLGAALKSVSAADMAGWAEDTLASNATHYAEEVKKVSKARRLLSVVQNTVNEIYESGDSDRASAALIDELIAMQCDHRHGFEPLSTAIINSLKLIEKAAKGQSVGIKTGFDAIDRATNGHEPGDLIVPAGRSGDGKTIYATQCGISAARAGHTVAFVSAEMSAAQIAQRILSTESGIENRDLRRGRITDLQAAKLTRLAGDLGSLPIRFLDSDRNWKSIKAKLRAEKLRDPKLSVAIVDYAQLIEGPKVKERYLEVGAISREAKALARELNVVFYLVSQLNRDAEDRRPRKSDLRESGNLEQDADFIGLLFRAAKFDEKQPEDLVFFDVVKNRHGPVGLIRLRFSPRTVSFADWVDQEVPDFKMRAASA